MKEELAGYYGEDEERFDTTEADWNGEKDYAELVTMGGQIVGALTPQIAATSSWVRGRSNVSGDRRLCEDRARARQGVNRGRRAGGGAVPLKRRLRNSSEE